MPVSFVDDVLCLPWPKRINAPRPAERFKVLSLADTLEVRTSLKQDRLPWFVDQRIIGAFAKATENAETGTARCKASDGVA